MHEVSLASGIIEIAGKAAQEAGGGKVRTIRVQVGALTCVDGESLRFAFGVLSQGTGMAGAALEIEAVPVTVQCGQCGSAGPPDDPLVHVCPRCGAPGAKLLTGRDITVRSIDLDV